MVKIAKLLLIILLVGLYLSCDRTEDIIPELEKLTRQLQEKPTVKQRKLLPAKKKYKIYKDRYRMYLTLQQLDKPLEKLKFPYENLGAKFTIWCGSSRNSNTAFYESIHFEFSNPSNNLPYIYRFRVSNKNNTITFKFDNNITQDIEFFNSPLWLSFFRYPKDSYLDYFKKGPNDYSEQSDFIDKMAKSNKLEYSVESGYGNKKVVAIFKHDITGIDKAIAEIRNTCKTF